MELKVFLYDDADRHRFDADPDTTFYFDADYHPDPTPSFTNVGKI
jgi:hypothetical protein